MYAGPMGGRENFCIPHGKKREKWRFLRLQEMQFFFSLLLLLPGGKLWWRGIRKEEQGKRGKEGCFSVFLFLADNGGGSIFRFAAK